MTYINHNVNVGLLFLIVMTTVSLISSTVFFQIKYDEVVKEYNSQADLIDDLAVELQVRQDALGKINNALKLAQERESALGQITARISAERERAARNPIRTTEAASVHIPKRENPPGVEVNSAFTQRPKRGGYAFDGFGSF